MTEQYVRPDVQSFLSLLSGAPPTKTDKVTPAAARLQYDALRVIADVDAVELATMVDLEFDGPCGSLSARLFDARRRRQPGPVLLFFHGGGFVIGDLDTHAAVCADMARALDLPVVALQYRLAPEHRWPAAPEDCEAAARWLAKCPDVLGRKITGLVLAGDSAGGTLAIVTAMTLRDAPAAVPVLAQLVFYPAADMSGSYSSTETFSEGYLLTRASMEWSAEMYAPDFGDWRASPMLGDLTGLPPAVVVTAGLDPIRDQGRAYASALVAAGVPTVFREASGNIHAFATLRKAIPSSQEDVTGALSALGCVIAGLQQARGV